MGSTRRAHHRRQRALRPALLLLGALAVLLGGLLTACGPPPVEVDANAPQVAERLAATWVAALPTYAATEPDPDPDAFVPSLTQAEGDADAVRVVRRAGQDGDGIRRMQGGYEAWLEQELREAAATGDVVALRAAGLAGGRAQGHLRRAAVALGKPDPSLDSAGLADLAARAGVTDARQLTTFTEAWTWAVRPFATADGATYSSAQLRRALASGPPTS